MKSEDESICEIERERKTQKRRAEWNVSTYLVVGFLDFYFGCAALNLEHLYKTLSIWCSQNAVNVVVSLPYRSTSSELTNNALV